MIERILIEMLSYGLPDSNKTKTILNESDAPQNTNSYWVLYFDGPAKLHIGFLSISLIVGLAYGGFVTYTCWAEGSKFLSYVRNLVIALTFKAFFSLLFEGVVILGNPWNVGGSNTLLSFECLATNLVFAFWLLLTIYLHARMQRNFNNEPSIITMYQYGIPGIAVFFSLVWIFGMEGQYGSVVWWATSYFLPIIQWITCSLRLLFLLVQLALIVDIGKSMMIKSSLDNDSLSLLRKVTAVMGILVFLFWLDFGLSVGRPPLTDTQSYLYFYYFIDGILCAIICPVFFLLNRWVEVLINDKSEIFIGDISRRATNTEYCINGNRTHSIVTIDSLLKPEENRKWKNSFGEESKDVVYSSVVQPEQLKKTLDLYKRLNLIPKNEEVVIEEEEFFECKSFTSKQNMFEGLEGVAVRQEVRAKPKTNKNAFYSSKYLILDSKEKDIPKYLEKHSSVSSAESESPQIQRQAGRNSSEFLKKWLSEHLDDKKNMEGVVDEKNKANIRGIDRDEDATKNVLKDSFETVSLPRSSIKSQNKEKLNNHVEIRSIKSNMSSDSEFDVEKKKLSTSSGEFDLDSYYSKVSQHTSDIHRGNIKK